MIWLIEVMDIRLHTTVLALIVIKRGVPVRRAILARMKDLNLIVRQLEVKDFSIFLDSRRGR